MIIEILGLAASIAFFVSFIGFVIFTVVFFTDDDPYLFRKMETEHWCAYMTFSYFLAISLIVILFVLP